MHCWVTLKRFNNILRYVRVRSLLSLMSLSVDWSCWSLIASRSSLDFVHLVHCFVTTPFIIHFTVNPLSFRYERIVSGMSTHHLIIYYVL